MPDTLVPIAKRHPQAGLACNQSSVHLQYNIGRQQARSRDMLAQKLCLGYMAPSGIRMHSGWRLLPQHMALH
eukprot:11169362-Lingulodinium_polyedra.AAC.1